MSIELKQTCVRRLNELSDAIRKEALDYVVQEARRAGPNSRVNALQYYTLVTQAAQKLLGAANRDLQEIFGGKANNIDEGPLTSMKELMEEEDSSTRRKKP